MLRSIQLTPSIIPAVLAPAAHFGIPMDELRDLMEEQLVVGERERRMDGRQGGDEVQVGLGGVEGEIEEEGLAPEPGHHQELREAMREGGTIAQRGVAVFARGQRREARCEQRVGGHRHGDRGHGRGGRGHGRGGRGRGRGGRGHGHGFCGGRGHVDYEGRQSWVCPK